MLTFPLGLQDFCYAHVEPGIQSDPLTRQWHISAGCTTPCLDIRESHQICLSIPAVTSVAIKIQLWAVEQTQKGPRGEQLPEQHMYRHISRARDRGEGYMPSKRRELGTGGACCGCGLREYRWACTHTLTSSRRTHRNSPPDSPSACGAALTTRRFRLWMNFAHPPASAYCSELLAWWPPPCSMTV